MMGANPRHAPEHLVRQLAVTTQPPLRPHYFLSTEQQQAAHLAQCRVWADRIWAEAFMAGATYGLAIAATPRMIVMSPEAGDVAGPADPGHLGRGQ
jgi:hypothetical protein